MKTITILAFCVSLALQAIGQQPPRPDGPGPGGPRDRGNPERMGEMMLETISAELGLDALQRNQVKAIFDQTREGARPIQDELQKLRQSMKDVVKAGKDAEAKALAVKIGDQHERLAALQGNAFGRVIKLLKPDQKTKADPIFDSLGAMTGGGRGGRPGGFGPPGQRTPGQPPSPGR